MTNDPHRPHLLTGYAVALAATGASFWTFALTQGASGLFLLGNALALLCLIPATLLLGYAWRLTRVSRTLCVIGLLTFCVWAILGTIDRRRRPPPVIPTAKQIADELRLLPSTARASQGSPSPGPTAAATSDLLPAPPVVTPSTVARPASKVAQPRRASPRSFPGPPPGAPPTPIVASVRIASQLAVASSNPDLPYALEVLIQTTQAIQPVAFLVKCTGEIGDATVGMGAGAYTKTDKGVVEGHPTWYAFEWEAPGFTPDKVIRLTLYSKTFIKVTSFEQFEYRWPLGND